MLKSMNYPRIPLPERRAWRGPDAGFTLSELLIVVGILAVLAAVAVPAFLNQRDRGYDASVKSDLRQIANAVQGSELTGPVTRNGGGDSVWIAYQKAADVKTTDGVSWNVSGTTEAFCITAFHERGRTFDEGHVLTYDSAAGGLGHSGGACSGTAADPRPFFAGASALPASGALTQPDPWCPTTCPPTPPLGPGAANLLPNSALSGPTNPAGGMYNAQVTVLEEATPVGPRAAQLHGINTTDTQGIIVAMRPELAPVSLDAGQKVSMSVYVKGSPDLRVSLALRMNKDLSGSSTLSGLLSCPAAQLTGGWQRLTCVATVNAEQAANTKRLNLNVRIAPTNPFGAGDTVLFTGWQMEYADKPSVFQPTM